MGAMKCCLHGVAGIVLAAGGVTAAEAQTVIAPEVVEQPAAAAVVPSATVLAQPTPIETTRQVTTTYRTSDRGRVVRRTVVTTRTGPVVAPRTVTEQVVAAPVPTVVPAPAYATSPYPVQGYTAVAPVIDQVGPPAAVVAPVAPARAYRYVYLDDRTLVVDPVNVVLATYWR